MTLQWSLIVSFGLDCYPAFSELTDKVSQSATQLLYREMTLSKCGVACTLLPVQKDADRLLKSDQLVSGGPILLYADSF